MTINTNKITTYKFSFTNQDIEALKKLVLEDYATEYDNKIKSEAVKECLAKVKNYIKTHCNPYGKPDFDYDTSIKILNFIDNLVKEMVGENNGG